MKEVLVKDLHAEIHFARVFMKPGYDTPVSDTDLLSLSASRSAADYVLLLCMCVSSVLLYM